MPFRHYRLLHFTLKRNLSEIYHTILLKTFAISLIGIFIPIYLLKEIGLTFPQLLLFLIVVYLSVPIGYLVGAIFGLKTGINRLVALSVPFYIIFYLLLETFNNLNISIYILALIFGIGDGIFWFAYHIDFAKFSDKKHRGEEVKLWFVLASILGMLGPLIGGFLLGFFPFYVLFSLVIILFILSALPLLKAKNVVVKYNLSIKETFNKKNYENSHRYSVQALRHVSNGILWPIFVFFLVSGYFSLGLVFSGAYLVSSFVVWFIGNQVDKINRKLFSDFSSMIDGLVSFAKLFVSSFSQIMSVAILGGVSHSANEISQNALCYDQANKTKIVSFLFYRELIFSISRITFLLVLFIAALDVIPTLKLAFILVGAASVLQWLF
ncbi:MAG: MFS transporter [Candidatus Woesearchaeota archaeon]